jgi:hypothetical protein
MYVCVSECMCVCLNVCVCIHSERMYVFAGRSKKSSDDDARLLVSTLDSRVRMYGVMGMALVCKYRGPVNQVFIYMHACMYVCMHVWRDGYDSCVQV